MHTKTQLILIVGLVTAVSVFAASNADAVVVPNSASGDIAGTLVDTTNATFNLDVTTLGLVKTAFLTSGTQLNSGDSISKGTTVQFMIYMDNATGTQVDSVNVSDVLNAAFAYETGSIFVSSTTVSSGVWTEADLRTAALAGTNVLDAVDGVDVAGISGATVSGGNGAGNAVLSIPADRVWVMLFTVKVQ